MPGETGPKVGILDQKENSSIMAALLAARNRGVSAIFTSTPEELESYIINGTIGGFLIEPHVGKGYDTERLGLLLRNQDVPHIIASQGFVGDVFNPDTNDLLRVLGRGYNIDKKNILAVHKPLNVDAFMNVAGVLLQRMSMLSVPTVMVA